MELIYAVHFLLMLFSKQDCLVILVRGQRDEVLGNQLSKLIHHTYMLVLNTSNKD